MKIEQRNLDRVSMSMYPLVKVITQDMSGKFDQDEGDKIIRHIIQLMKPNDVSELLAKLKYSIDNISQVLISSILNYELNIHTSNQTEPVQIDERIDKSMTIKEVVSLMNISRPTLHQWFKNGLKTSKIGGRVFINQSDLNEYIKNHQK